MLPVADLSSRLSFDVQGAAALRMKAASGDPAALKAAARQFEAMFIQTMLKTARQTHFTSDGDVFGDSSSMKLYQELLDQQWAEKIVGGKGLGFADMIVKRLTQDAANEAAMNKMAAGDTARGEQAAETAPHTPLAVPQAVGYPLEHRAAAEQTKDASQESGGRHSKREQSSDRKQRFVEAMRPYAEQAEKVSGVPARFVLAHAALESGWGQREIVAADGTSSHNLFGIKAGAGWDGNSVNSTTTEYRQGVAMKISAKFRAYADYAEAFIDYARLLKRRYSGAVAAGNDAQAFASGLARGGYATDPDYMDKLRGTIRSIAAAGA